MKTIILAWRYIRFHKLKSALLIACIALTIALPISIHLLLIQFNRQIMTRAESTPLVLGARGSRLDLTLSSLYLTDRNPTKIRYSDLQDLVATGYADAIPLYLGFKAQGYSVVGTSVDYFPFRTLEFEKGGCFRRLGDCVVGWEVAKALNIEPGQEIKSDRANSLDIASNPPLYMRVTGILRRKRTADDRAVFVDLKTSWVLDGLGHGHEDLGDVEDETKVLKKDGNTTTASAAVTGSMRINETNISSFHFHGDIGDFPISAAIALPGDQKSCDLLLGRYLSDRNPLQILEPVVVVLDLMGLVFRAKQFFDANAIIISLATLMLLIMVIVLSLKLRQREMETMFKIGCSPWTIAQMLIAELGLIGIVSLILVAGIIFTVSSFADEIVQTLVIQQ